MIKKNNKPVIEKALKPSQRESITEFSTHFGSEESYEEKVKKRRILSGILIALGIMAVIAVGYFITDVLVRITELPYVPTNSLLISVTSTV